MSGNSFGRGQFPLLVHTHVGRNRLFFFSSTPVLLTNDHITIGEKMNCRDSEISGKAELGVCSWGISVGCTADAGQSKLCCVNCVSLNWQQPGQHLDLTKVN